MYSTPLLSFLAPSTYIHPIPTTYSHHDVLGRTSHFDHLHFIALFRILIRCMYGIACSRSSSSRIRCMYVIGIEINLLDGIGLVVSTRMSRVRVQRYLISGKYVCIIHIYNIHPGARAWPQRTGLVVVSIVCVLFLWQFSESKERWRRRAPPRISHPPRDDSTLYLYIMDRPFMSISNYIGTTYLKILN